MQTITVVIALFALCVSIVVAGWTIYRDAFATRSQRQKRIKGNFTAMYVEVDECGRIATGYKTAGIDTPLYPVRRGLDSFSILLLLTDKHIGSWINFRQV